MTEAPTLPESERAEHLDRARLASFAGRLFAQATWRDPERLAQLGALLWLSDELDDFPSASSRSKKSAARLQRWEGLTDAARQERNPPLVALAKDVARPDPDVRGRGRDPGPREEVV